MPPSPNAWTTPCATPPFQQARTLAEATIRRAYAGGDAAIGWPEVADSLVRHRAGHLIVGADAVLDPAVLSPARKPHWAGRLPGCSSSVRSSRP
jgi:hypothetical protein